MIKKSMLSFGFNRLRTSKFRTASLGLTLIELLVVIVIIGVLATLTSVLLYSSRSKAVDAKKLVDMRTVITALEQYANDENRYPDANQMKWGEPLIGPTSNRTYMNKLPNQTVGLSYGSVCKGSNAIYIYNWFSAKSYNISYCLDNPQQGCPAGPKIARPGLVMECDNVTSTAGVSTCSAEHRCGGNGIGGFCGDCPYGLKCNAKDETGPSSCVACTVDSDCPETVGGRKQVCTQEGNCYPCVVAKDCNVCSFCQVNAAHPESNACTVLSVANTPEPANRCADKVTKCTDYVAGWAGAICNSYSASTTSNGTCNGFGDCNTPNVTSDCKTPIALTTCGSPSCVNTVACAVASTTINNDTVAKICYTDNQSHGACLPPNVCSAGGNCVCIPNCSGKACGSDGCGGFCGAYGGRCSTECDYCYSGVCKPGHPCPSGATVTGASGIVYNTVWLDINKDGKEDVGECWTKENMAETSGYNGYTLNKYTNTGEYTCPSGMGDVEDCNSVRSGNTSILGYLYNYAGVMGKNWMCEVTSPYNCVDAGEAYPRKGICPTGWHIPLDSDWRQMLVYAQAVAASQGAQGLAYCDQGFCYSAGHVLKEVGSAYWTGGSGANNCLGFTIRGTGYAEGGNSSVLRWYSRNNYAIFLVSQSWPNYINSWMFGNSSGQNALVPNTAIWNINGNRLIWRSVRCIKNTP